MFKVITLISYLVLNKVNTRYEIIMKERTPLNIETSYTEFEYNENSFAGLVNMTQSNLLFTSEGTVTAKDNL
ncbi:hypothetical protein [Staphylococcus gallinarum]|uniref:hypothetical protein n=1 Tax=Staphylococcus gallinarum TaxID=1293 RepID=UPI00316F3799